ncbi:MAG: hypothetical protein K8S18_11330 [Desulfobacula sp.]|nr:hypothetical protein [Desulfobacula sp.]
MIELHKIGSIIDQLRRSVVLFEELFGNKDSVKELNRVSAQSFGLFKSALWYQIIMRIASLLDPAKTGKAENLTFKRLAIRMDECVQSEMESYILYHGVDLCKDKLASKIKLLENLKDEIAELESLYKKTKIKNYRNKLGAHFDVEYSV